MSAGAGRPRISAGIVLFRRIDGPLEVLLAHPGGPFFVRKDEGHWTIPKGEVDDGEVDDDAGLLVVARREFAEETGHPAPAGDGLNLGSVVQKGGKVVHAWAFEGELDPTTAKSNTFEIAWPPGSGRRTIFPEIDRVAWFEPVEARRRIKPSQIPLLDRLEELLRSGDVASTLS
ncbi:MAG TPA: NUDIX domain-containing protein [Candidatus Acidoferrum sp.]|nr:NUDIX domain-containing protein [Candidatus Acidoferrum sp.]